MSRITAVFFILAGLAACDRSTVAPYEAQYAPGSGGASRSAWPSSTDPGPPFYARIIPSTPHIYHDGTWAAVVFYRDPDCVPADFNLLSFFNLAAFGCDLLVSGASIWVGTPGAGAPRVTTASGTPQVWFFPAAAVPGLLADGVLTIGELRSVPGLLKGTAQQFSETLQPHPVPALGGGGHPNPGITLVATGVLEDGRRFQFQLRHDDRAIRSLRITIR